MDKIKILTIAPYQELEYLVRDIAKDFDNIEMYTFTGYYKNAIQFAKAFPDKEFDVIISRGGTATLVRSLNDTPVVEVEVSTLDLLRVIKQAVQCSPKAAVVSYPDVTARVEMLAQFLRLDIKTFSFDLPEQIEETVRRCVRAGYQLIVGGAATREYTVAEGAQFMLIASSRESVEASIRRAIEQYHLMNSVQDRNRLYQSIVDKSDAALFLFSGEKNVQYMNVAARRMLNSVDRLEQFLARNIDVLEKNQRLHLLKKMNNDVYEVNGNAIMIRQQPHYLFELHFRSAGCRVASVAQIENPEEIRRSQQLLGSSELYLRPLAKAIQTAGESMLPVLIQGEVGTCKGLVARKIHGQQVGESTSLICLRCGDLTEKNWNLLLNNADSPIHAMHYTVYLDHVDALTPELQRQVSAYIEDSKMTRRHRLISSSCCDLSAEVARGRFSSRLYMQLSGFTINVPSLAQRREDIPAFVNRMLPQLNTLLSKSVVGMEPDAMELMTRFDWPLNLVQLEKVLRQIMAAPVSFYISAEEVQAVLSNEERKTAAASFDLSGTLEDIERRIIQQVLKEENMNQSAAAKRLGIGRSTLWRKISAGEGQRSN